MTDSERLQDLAERLDGAEISETQVIEIIDCDPTAKLALRLTFSPTAIREHFGDSNEVEDLSREVLLQVGSLALQDDRIYAAFNLALRDAMIEVAGFDPDANTEDEEEEEEANVS